MGMFADKVVHYKSRIKFDKELWKFQTGGAIASTPAIVNDAIIFGSDLSVYLKKEGHLKDNQQ